MKTKGILFIAAILLGSHLAAQTAEPADKVMDKAFSQASSENKSVLVIFHASWCKYCKMLEAAINDPSIKDIFYKHYVIAELTINESADKKNLENQGAIDLFNKYGGQGQGIPYFLFFDSKRKFIADSKIMYADAKPGAAASNVGFPTTEEEINAFIEKLKASSKFSAKEIEAIKARFTRNKN